MYLHNENLSSNSYILVGASQAAAKHRQYEPIDDHEPDQSGKRKLVN